MALASDEELAELPTPDMITLLFKCHKSTTALSVLPTKAFPEIKPLLLGALQSRNVKMMPNSTVPLPEDPEELEFGVLVDKKDPNKGWVLLEVKEQEVAGARNAKKKSVGKDSPLGLSPLGLGLADGAWVAYRIKVQQKSLEGKDKDEDDDGQEPGTPDIEIDEDPGFDVVIPTFEDDAD